MSNRALFLIVKLTLISTFSFAVPDYGPRITMEDLVARTHYTVENHVGENGTDFYYWNGKDSSVTKVVFGNSKYDLHSSVLEANSVYLVMQNRQKVLELTARLPLLTNSKYRSQHLAALGDLMSNLSLGAGHILVRNGSQLEIKSTGEFRRQALEAIKLAVLTHFHYYGAIQTAVFWVHLYGDLGSKSTNNADFQVPKDDMQARLMLEKYIHNLLDLNETHIGALFAMNRRPCLTNLSFLDRISLLSLRR